MNSPLQPTLAELTSRALAARSNTDAADLGGDVEPHEVLSGIRIDATAAWNDAQLPLKLLGVTVAPKSPPSEWGAFVEWNPGRLGIPMAAGQFPQRLREIAGLFAAELREPIATNASSFATLKGWIDRSPIGDAGLQLLANGIARELGETSEIRGNTPAELNERAADLWIRGEREAALAVWQQMPTSAVASFNLGMAFLMLGRAKLAVPHLELAVAQLPDSSGWQHLAALYLSVARVRG